MKMEMKSQKIQVFFEKLTDRNTDVVYNEIVLGPKHTLYREHENG